MNEIIKITKQYICDDQIQTVNARELHIFLEVGKDFSTWVKDRIEKYNFVENQDFVCSPILGSEGRGGQNRVDYHLSLDMAKELAMVERNEKGKQARQYFIECEKKAKQTLDPAKALNDPVIMRSLLLNYSEKVIDLEHQVSEMKPQTEAFKRISFADGNMCITDAAKTLQIQPKRLFAYLNENLWIYRRSGNKNWVAYQDRIQTGLLIHKVTTITTSDGEERVQQQALVTPRGLARLSEHFSQVEAA